MSLFSACAVGTPLSRLCVVVCVVVCVVWDARLDVRCAWSQRHGNAMSPRTNLRVAVHLGVRLPTDPATPRTPDDEELFIVEGAPRDSTPLGGVRKMAQNAPEKHPFRLKTVILSMTESEAPPLLNARTSLSTTLSVNATAALSGPLGNCRTQQRQQPCSRTALWNLPSVAQLECPALGRGN